MIVIKAKIQNYKSFLDSEEINLTPGFNVIVGKNNSGKTALAEILSLRFSNNPHKSKASKPEIDSTISNQESSVILNIKANREEIINIFLQREKIFQLPKHASIRENELLNKIQDVFSKDNLIFKSTYKPGKEPQDFLLPDWGFSATDARRFSVTNPTSIPDLMDQNQSYNDNLDMAKVVSRLYRERVFLFVAERFKVGQYKAGTRNTLEPDASNLPEALLSLRSTQATNFNLILRYMGEIFNDVKDIQIPNEMISDTLTSKIYYSSYSPDEQRVDLRIPLQDSGTGLGQVLAFLYVVITSNNPRTFIIDEPQSFLHPGAVRKLFNILQKDFSHHQYIITTHSPAAITAANSQNIIHLVKPEEQTVTKNIDINEATEMRSILGDVGARLSDVFGADKILWVEGATEEHCFPEIISKNPKLDVSNTAILGVIHTGDFDSKKKNAPQTIMNIYNRLSGSTALIPPAIGYIFDRDGRSPEKMQELEKESKGKIRFLKRRLYENYLINPEVLEVFFSTQPEFSESKPSAAVICDWLENNKWDDKYFSEPAPEKNRNEEFWFREVHGAKILDAYFKTLKNSYINYKVTYSLKLTKITLEISPEDLNDISELLNTILNKSQDA
jgi:predicted ATPase